MKQFCINSVNNLIYIVCKEGNLRVALGNPPRPVDEALNCELQTMKQLVGLININQDTCLDVIISVTS